MNRSGQRAVNCGTASCRAWGNTEKKIFRKMYASLRTALQRAEAKKMEVEQQIREYLNMTSNLEAHLDDFGFDAQLVKSLVQRIEVSADKRIRIVFGFQDVLADFGKESAGK